MQTVLRLRANGAQERGRERSGWGLAATPGEPRMIETEWHTHGNECMRRKETRTKHSGCAHVPYVREEGEATVKGTMPTTWRRWQGTHLRNGANIFHTVTHALDMLRSRVSETAPSSTFQVCISSLTCQGIWRSFEITGLLAGRQSFEFLLNTHCCKG